MEQASFFLLNLSFSLSLALVLGISAKRFRLSPIIGYLLAGIVLSPHTPTFVADAQMAHDFAEVGIILLIFFGDVDEKHNFSFSPDHPEFGS